MDADEVEEMDVVDRAEVVDADGPPAAPGLGGLGIRVVVNPASGSERGDELVEGLRERLPKAEIVVLEGDRTIQEIADADPPPDALGVCGGDGTVSAAAACAFDHKLPLAVIPGGTLNHFAADLAICSFDEAIEAIERGRTRPVDVAEIDGRRFVNNASLGVYSDVVDTRERLERRIGKWPALVVALIVVLRHGKPRVIELDGRRRRVWFAFFGNCRYDESGFAAPSGRSQLDDGLIDVRLVHADRRFARLRLLASALIGRSERSSVYESYTSARITVRSLDGGAVRLAADGETFDGGEVFEVRKWPSGLLVYAGQAVRGSGASASMS